MGYMNGRLLSVVPTGIHVFCSVLTCMKIYLQDSVTSSQNYSYIHGGSKAGITKCHKQ